MPITLNANEVYAALNNMILGIHVYADNIYDAYGSILDGAKSDAGLYGDKKLYIATDTLFSSDWLNDAEAANLLALDRGPAPDTQVLEINVFRKVWVTTDSYMSKRAFAEEGTFQQFNSVVLSWIQTTKRTYEKRTYNAFIGTDETNTGNQQQTVTFTTVTDPEGAARMQAMEIMQKIADIIDDVQDENRLYNDLEFFRSYAEGDLRVVWSSEWLNKIEKRDLPTTFHQDFVEHIGDYKLPSKFFGTINSAATAGDNSTVRSLVEQVIGTNHYFPGELILVGDTAPAGTSYTVDGDIICKIIHKNSVPFLTSFSASTEFFNPRSLTRNNYLIWGHNTLQHLEQYPFITLRAV